MAILMFIVYLHTYQSLHIKKQAIVMTDHMTLSPNTIQP